MQTPYRIQSDAAKRLVTIGFEVDIWTLGLAERFLADVVAAVVALGCAPGQHMILADLRNAVLQSRDVYDRVQAFVGAATAARIALVAALPLARMQTKRLQVRENVVMFAEMEQAEAWLSSAEESAAA